MYEVRNYLNVPEFKGVMRMDCQKINVKPGVKFEVIHENNSIQSQQAENESAISITAFSQKFKPFCCILAVCLHKTAIQEPKTFALFEAYLSLLR